MCEETTTIHIYANMGFKRDRKREATVTCEGLEAMEIESVSLEKFNSSTIGNGGKLLRDGVH